MNTDLTGRLPTIRDQGLRPVCLAYAISDGHAVAKAFTQHLCADFLHYHATQRQGVPFENGVFLEHALDALSIEGQPIRKFSPPPWRLPANPGPLYRSETATAEPGKCIDLIESELAVQRACVLTFWISDSFLDPDPVTYLVDDDKSPFSDGHAVVIVGAQGKGKKRLYRARNSWGDEWGEFGYVWLTRGFIEARALDLVAFIK